MHIHLAPIMAHWGRLLMNFTILISLLIQMLFTKYGNNRLCSFLKVKNVKSLTHNDGRKTIAIGHLSESGHIKRGFKHIVEILVSKITSSTCFQVTQDVLL